MADPMTWANWVRLCERSASSSLRGGLKNATGKPETDLLRAEPAKLIAGPSHCASLNPESTSWTPTDISGRTRQKECSRDKCSSEPSAYHKQHQLVRRCPSLPSTATKVVVPRGYPSHLATTLITGIRKPGRRTIPGGFLPSARSFPTLTPRPIVATRKLVTADYRLLTSVYYCLLRRPIARRKPH